MDYQFYNDYMRNMSGYPNMRDAMPMFPYPNNPYSDDLERMYPDVYKVIYPIVCFTCDNITVPVTYSMVDAMTNEIYDKVEADGRININIAFDIDTRDNELNENELMDSNERRPRRRNRFLRDLIRILLLRELIDRRPKHHHFRPY